MDGPSSLRSRLDNLTCGFPRYGAWPAFHLLRGEFEKTATLGRAFLDLAEPGDAALQVEGHFLLGSSLAFQGDLATGLGHLDRAIDCFDLEQHGRVRVRLGSNPGVAAHTTAALLLWLSGKPIRAATQAGTAIELARQLDHPFTLAYTYFHVGFLDLWRHEWSLVEQRADHVFEVADRFDYQIWKALAIALQGVATTWKGRVEEGIARIHEGIALYEGLRTPPVFWPLVLYLHALGFAHAGRTGDGLGLINEAIDLAGRGFLYPEFACSRGICS